MEQISNIIRHSVFPYDTPYSRSIFRWQVRNTFFPFSASDLFWRPITGPGISMIPWSLFLFLVFWNLWVSTKPRLHLRLQCSYLSLLRPMYVSINLSWILAPSDSGKYIGRFGGTYNTRIYDGRNEDSPSVPSEMSSTSKHISSFRTIKTEKLLARRWTITCAWLLFCSSDWLPVELIGS